MSSEAPTDLRAAIASLDPAARATLEDGHERLTLEVGDALFERGAEPDGIYLLLEGALEVQQRLEGGDVVPLASLGPGEGVGEMGTLLSAPRSATVRAAAPSSLVRFTPAAFRAFLERHPREATQVLTQLLVESGRRMRRSNDQVRAHLEDRVRRLEEDACEKDLLALIVHDLRTPVAVASAGVSQLLDQGDRFGPLTPKQLRVLHRVRRSHAFVRQLLDEVMEVGRSEAGVTDRTETCLTEVVMRAVPPALERVDDAPIGEDDAQSFDALRRALGKRDIHLDVDGTGSTRFLTDRTRLVHVLLNLVGNAVKHAPGWLRISARLVDGRARFRVTDRGTGVPPEYQDKIFERFEQGRVKEQGVRRGFGFGLAGARTLVQGLGGRIWHETPESGEGSTFVFEVPVEEAG